MHIFRQVQAVWWLSLTKELQTDLKKVRLIIVDVVRQMQSVWFLQQMVTKIFVFSGSSAIGSVFRKTDDEESINVLKKALKCGFNMIDTAPWYGHGKSETVLGRVGF